MARRPRRHRLLGALAGAALCLGVAAPATAQRADQTAMGASRPAKAGGGVGLPQPLASEEAARLRRVFALQAEARWDEAEAEAARLADRRLLGHVLADRWLREGAPVPGEAALREWLARHADHPDAPVLHDRLVRLLPAGAPPAPALPAEPDLPADLDLPPEEREPTGRAPARNPALDRAVRERAAAGDVRGALAQVARTRGMNPAYAGRLRAEVAEALFRQGRDAEAYRVGAEAARLAPASGQGAFVAGLAAWGMERYDAALPQFEAAARAEEAAPALRSAAAFWTGRAAVRARQPQHYVPWMLQAAQEPRTFYGMVARRSLGLATGFAWERDAGAAAADGAALAETAGGLRALALLQVGQRARAEAELRRLWGAAAGNPQLARAMLAVASEAGLSAIAAQVAGLAQGADGRPRDLARFPVPRLRPEGGFRVDPTLLYGMARQESNFDPEAVSPAGARGLMQIMPATASFVANDPSLAGDNARRLHDPAFSLELGQRYVAHLAGLDVVRGDLIRLLAAYNAGPGNLARWLPAQAHRDDPFLFIEAIPVTETRQYVQRVLAYSWIYASRLDLPAPSLDQIAAGGFPRYQEPAAVSAALARRRPAGR